LFATALLLGLLVHVADLLPRPAGKRLDSIGVENTQENRRAYRTLLLNAPGALQN
jgi:fructose-bisphosphate aldolase class 1